MAPPLVSLLFFFFLVFAETSQIQGGRASLSYGRRSLSGISSIAKAGVNKTSSLSVQVPTKEKANSTTTVVSHAKKNQTTSPSIPKTHFNSTTTSITRAEKNQTTSPSIPKTHFNSTTTSITRAEKNQTTSPSVPKTHFNSTTTSITRAEKNQTTSPSIPKTHFNSTTTSITRAEKNQTTFPSLPKTQSNSTTKIQKISSNSTTTQLKLETPKTQNFTTKTTQKRNQTQLQATAKEPKELVQEEKRAITGMPWHEDGDLDLISEIIDLPSQLHETLLPDLEKISSKSKAYLTVANKEFANSFKPIVGKKYASPIGTAAFLLLPLVLVTIIFNHLRHYLSLQKMIISVQIYLAIYFSTLSIFTLFTGIEPLKFFYATTPDSYVYTQVLQTLGYVLYLLLQLMNLVVVFSTGFGLGSRSFGLVQMIVGLAVGLHYYTAVSRRAVLREPPKTNWKIHTVYAVSFLVICVFARAERRKKAYFQHDGVEESKTS